MSIRLSTVSLALLILAGYQQQRFAKTNGLGFSILAIIPNLMPRRPRKLQPANAIEALCRLGYRIEPSPS